MVSEMDDDPKPREVYELADALMRGDITAEQSDRLGWLIENDADARLHYLRYMHDSAKLCRWSTMWSGSGGNRRGAEERGEGREGWKESAGERGGPADDSPSDPSAPAAWQPFPRLPSHAVAAMLSPLHFSINGVLLSYLCVVLVFATGLVGARWWGRTHAARSFGGGVAFSPASAPAAPALLVVGRITAMSNCQWLDPQTAAHEGEPVPRGRSYALTAGLLQIAYNTGARVILQGPVVYTVDAPNGGSLFLGKLTVEAGKLDRAAMTESEKARNHPAPPPRAAAFCVRTHTAIVLDKGDQDAKFGVEVDRSVATYTRVFRGTVIFTSPGFEPRSIPAGVCVWTGAGAKRNGLFIFKPGPQSLIFVTQMPKPPPVCAADPAGQEKQRRAGGG